MPSYLRRTATLLAVHFYLTLPASSRAQTCGEKPHPDIADDLRGLLVEAGFQTGRSHALQAMSDIQPHRANPGSESSIGGSFSLAWRESHWRWGATAAYDVFSTTADAVTTSYFGEQMVQSGSAAPLISRTSALVETEVALPVSRIFSLTAGAGLGRNWIRVDGFWENAAENNLPPGWMGNILLGVEASRDGGNMQMRMGWEKFSYSMSGRDGVSHDMSDERFVFDLRMGLSVLFPRSKPGARPIEPPRARDTSERIPSTKTDSSAGSRTPESILQVIRLNIDSFRAAYDRRLRDCPDLDGKIQIKFTIGPSGDVLQARIVLSKVHDESLENEILDLVRKLKFEAIEKGNVTVTYAFVLDKQ